MKINPQSPGAQKGLISTIAITGLIAGTLDILIAFGQFYLKTGKNPMLILRFISSAVFGRAAFEGGSSMLATGLLFHYIIAFCWTIVLFLMYPFFIKMLRNKFVVAIVYGGLIWLMMNLVVLRLTKLPPANLQLMPSLMGALILVVAIGLPVSLLADKYYRK